LFVLHVEHVGFAWSMTLSICLVLNYECSCVAMCPLTLCEHTMNMVLVDNFLGLFFKCIFILLSLLNSFFCSYAFSYSFYTSCGCYPSSTFVEDLMELYFLIEVLLFCFLLSYNPLLWSGANVLHGQEKHVVEIQKSLSKNCAKSIWKHRDDFLFNDYLYCIIFLVRFVKDICLYIIVLTTYNGFLLILMKHIINLYSCNMDWAF